MSYQAVAAIGVGARLFALANATRVAVVSHRSAPDPKPCMYAS
jgi:hypothetical protein